MSLVNCVNLVNTKETGQALIGLAHRGLRTKIVGLESFLKFRLLVVQ